MSREQFNFFATTAKGMEPLLSEELLKIGASDIVISRAGVAFRGTVECAYKACLWSRTASRVLLVLKKIRVRNADELYAAVDSIQWADHLTSDNTFAVHFSKSEQSQNQQIRHTHFAALKV